MAEYLHPEVLVSTQWAAEHLNDPWVRLIEVELDTAAYDQGHIPRDPKDKIGRRNYRTAFVAI